MTGAKEWAGIALTPICGQPLSRMRERGRVSGLEHGEVTLERAGTDRALKYAYPCGRGQDDRREGAGRERPHPDLRSPLSRMRERGSVSGLERGEVTLERAGTDHALKYVYPS